jgi:hypothetical protein
LYVVCILNMASNYVLNQKITAALAKSAEALAAAQGGGGGGGGGGAPETLAQTLQTSGTINTGALSGQTAGAGNAFNQPITNGGEIESTNHQIIKANPILGGNGTALGDITFDAANGDNLIIRTVGTRDIQIGATSGTDKIGIGKVPDSAGSKIQVDGGINCEGSYLGEGFTLLDTNGALHSLATYDLANTRVQMGTTTDDFRIRGSSTGVYDFTASEMKSTEKVRFDHSGLHAPATFASRENGDRVVLYSPANGTNDQYTMGIEGGAVRMSSGQSFKFYYRPPTYFTDLGVGEYEAFRIEAALGGTNLSLRPFTTRGDLKVLDSTATTTSLHVDTTNSRVGINKANPTEVLDVDGNIQINTSGTGSLKFYDNTGAHDHAQVTGEDDGTNGGKLVLKTKTDGGAVEARITVDGVGAIGIGPTPNYGTSGQVLTSQGPAATPIWATPSGGGGGGTTVYGGTWFPNIYTFYYVAAGQIMYANYYTPGDSVNNPWYSSTYNGDSHGRYAVTVFPGTPNRYKVDLWFKLYCGGSGSTANDIYKWGYNLQANSTSVNGAIRHGGFGNGATAGVTFDAAGNINGGQLTLECGFDVSDFMTKINTAVGTNLTFDTALVPGNEVNLGNSVFYEHLVSPTGVIRPLGQSSLNNLVLFNENGWARGFDPTDANPQDASIPAGTGNSLTSLGWSGISNGNPQIVPFGKSPSDIFSMTNSSVSGSEFYSANNASTRGSIRQFGGTLSYWMVDA